MLRKIADNVTFSLYPVCSILFQFNNNTIQYFIHDLIRGKGKKEVRYSQWLQVASLTYNYNINEGCD